MTSPSRAWSIASDFMKSGASGTTGSSRPLKRTATAPGFTPARSSTSRSRTPTHLALPMAPFSHCPPATRGANSPRELPEHWLTAASSTRGIARMSAMVSDSAWFTCPARAAERGEVDLFRDHRPVPADEEAVVGGEHALVEHLPRRFQQRRPGALEHHRAFLGEVRGHRALLRPAVQVQAGVVGQGRRGQAEPGKRRGSPYQAAPAQCVAGLHVTFPS